MTFEMLLIIIIGIVVVLVGLLIIAKFAPRPIRKTKFQDKWKDVYKYCARKDTWPTALTRADELLDLGLKRRRYKGKNMGERLVAAQKVFSDNDGIWVAHKLSVKLRDHPRSRVSETQVKAALVSFRQGLKDLGLL